METPESSGESPEFDEKSLEYSRESPVYKEISPECHEKPPESGELFPVKKRAPKSLGARSNFYRLFNSSIRFNTDACFSK